MGQLEIRIRLLFSSPCGFCSHKATKTLNEQITFGSPNLKSENRVFTSLWHCFTHRPRREGCHCTSDYCGLQDGISTANITGRRLLSYSMSRRGRHWTRSFLNVVKIGTIFEHLARKSHFLMGSAAIGPAPLSPRPHDAWAADGNSCQSVFDGATKWALVKLERVELAY